MATNSFCTSNHILVGLGGTGGKILKAFKMSVDSNLKVYHP